MDDEKFYTMLASVTWKNACNGNGTNKLHNVYVTNFRLHVVSLGGLVYVYPGKSEMLYRV